MHNRSDKMDERQILRALEMIARVRPSEQSTDKAIAAVRRRLLEGQIPDRPVVYRLIRHPAFRMAVAACLVVAIGLAVFMSGYRRVNGPSSPPIAGTVRPADLASTEVLARQIESLYKAGDVEGLIRLVQADIPLEARLEAARCLAQMSPDTAQAVLSRLAGTEGQVPGLFAAILAEVRSKTTETVHGQGLVANDQVVSTGPPPVLAARLLDAYTGRPIPNLDVILEGPELLKAKTGPDGLFSLTSVRIPGQYRIHINSDRYVDLGQDDPGSIVTLPAEYPVVRDIYTEPGFVIDAEVLDQGGKPIPGVSLVVSWLGQVQANDVAIAQTDQAGKARIGPLRQQTVAYQIAAIHEAYATQRALVECADCNLPQQVRIVLDKGSSITGYARYQDGTAAEGLLLYVIPQWWHSNTLPRPCTTGSDGLFTLEQVQMVRSIIKAGIAQPDGRIYTITVGQIVPTSGEEGPVAITVPGRSLFDQAVLCGTIRWTGGRTAKYVDLLAYSVPGTIIRQRLQGQLSSFTITGLIPGAYTLVFEGPNIAEKVIGPVSVPGPDLQVALSYVPTPRLQGMVLDAGTGRPIEQFRVGLIKQRRWPGLVYQINEPQWHPVRKPDGRFDIPTDGPGIYRLHVEADGFIPAVFDAVDADRNSGLFIQLARGGSIKGRVLAKDGQPISGATVTAILGRQLEIGGTAGRAYQGSCRTRSVDGQFLLEHLPPGIHSIQVRYPGFATTVVEGIEVMEGRQTDWVTVTLTEGGSVEGVVYDAQGQPQPDVTIRFVDAETNYMPAQEDSAILAVVQTDRQGRYRVDQIPQMACWVQWQDASGTTRRMIRPIAGKVIGLDLGSGARIEGTLAMDGQGDSGRAALLADPAGPSSGGFVQRTACDQQGRFRFHGVPKGRYGLYTQGTVESARWIKLAELQVHDQDLQLGQIPGQMSSMAVRLVGGPRTADWKVQVRQGDVPWGQQCGQLDPSEQEPGLYVIRYLLPGVYTIVAEDRTSGWLVTKTVVIDERADLQQVVLEIPTGNCSLSGIVIGGTGAPLYLHNPQAGLWVRIKPIEGYYRITGLPAGQYTIGNLYLQDRLPLAKAELAEGQNRILDLNPLRWSGANQGMLSVQVSSPDGLPIKDVSVWLEGRSGRIDPVLKTDIEQVFIAPAGHYRLCASGQGLVTMQRQVTIQANDLLAIVPIRPVVQLMLESE